MRPEEASAATPPTEAEVAAASEAEVAVPTDLEFDAIVAPLELALGKRLNGEGRRKCIAAFAEAPVGFQGIVAEALKRARGFGLLILMVEDGDHRLGDARGRVEQAIAWADRTAHLLPAEVQDEVIAGFALSPADEADIRERIELAQYVRA